MPKKSTVQPVQNKATQLDPQSWLALHREEARRKSAKPVERSPRAKFDSTALSAADDPLLAPGDQSDAIEPPEGRRKPQPNARALTRQPDVPAKQPTESVWEISKDYPDAVNILSRQLAQVSGGAGAEGNSLEENFALLRTMVPEGGIQSMLAIHLVTTHNAIVRVAAKLNSSTDPAAQDRLADALSKLSRTFAIGIEALMKLQAKAKRDKPFPFSL